MNPIQRIPRFLKKTKAEQRIILLWLWRRGCFLLASRLIGGPLGLFVLFWLDFFEPFFKWRISKIHVMRIGHLALNIDLFLRRQQLQGGPEKGVRHVFVTDSSFVANRPLLEMWKRHLNISESTVLRGFLNLSGWILEKTPFFPPLPMSSTEWAEFNQAAPSLKFTDAEEALGQKELAKMGIDPNKNWIALVFARDSGYLTQTLPKENWDCHLCRNSKIESFRPLITHLIDQGAVVLRMGTHITQPFLFDHPNYLDYSNRFRTPFMDIYLAAKARLFVGSASGMADVTNLFDTPRLQLDCVPFGFLPFGKKQMSLPKRVCRFDSREPVPYREIIEKGLALEGNGTLFNRAGYDYLDNSPEEMLLATKELLRWISSEGGFEPAEVQLIEKARDLFPQGHPARSNLNPISPGFISKYPELFI
ncbi:MAG: hypothetical protein A2508_03555 [Candidatus Lambdaproteobacteria bacterium RIFOXYD12_FULL_49_8]|uniref:TIGR04372 family glycosyltransferase n=1 Tax=Candidatus Lambdaproteobacteria bacterium RIFOXYD2_FULL_50_16 TaxID=1817772 RepID=A0A1F6GD63_9PROT|nr:MAG: hypothetical protein A2527_12000 [Candidatus Lambdaproteobacteria bacterium RIFOXYD2_FULL_50_16]OGG96261.1 MAG: hypothetical protein A2508_03555 [Candidatus Lambdaproteobacteria bacterium RIFOXYD12_FULL_49_8]